MGNNRVSSQMMVKVGELISLCGAKSSLRQIIDVSLAGVKEHIEGDTEFERRKEVERFQVLFNQLFDVDVIYDLVIVELARFFTERFTEEELVELIAMQRRPVSQKMQALQGSLLQSVIPVMEKYMATRMDKLKEFDDL